MASVGFIGGPIGYGLLRRLGRSAAEGQDHCSGAAYRDHSKLEMLFGPDIWREVRGKTVLDFGCGAGREVIEIARHGAHQVIGVERQQKVLDVARRSAHAEGLTDRCVFGAETRERVDVAFSVDGFEHYDDPAGVLRLLHGLLVPGGILHICFGPPWFHPYGGHLFSVFPWAHLIFTENALLRWRSDFKLDGARRFHEVAGGLNQMTVGRFRRLVARSDFEIRTLQCVPIRHLPRLSIPVAREFTTAMVRCDLMAHP